MFRESVSCALIAALVSACLLAAPASADQAQTLASFAPTQVEFGDVPVGSSSSQKVTVSSTGSALKIDQVQVEGTGGVEEVPVTVSDDTCSGAGIVAGSSCSFRLTFNPTSRKSLVARARISGTGLSEAIDVTGNGVQPAAEFDKASLDFGPATIGFTGDRPTYTLNLQSTGLDPVKVISLAVSGPDADSFRLADAGVCSAAIPVNEKCQMSVIFDPTTGDQGSRNATLVAETTGGTVTVALTGTAQAAVTLDLKFGVNCPKKAKVGDKISCTINLVNPLPFALEGAKVKFTGTQGKPPRTAIKGSTLLPTVAAGGELRKKVRISIPSTKLKPNSGKLLISFELISQKKPIAKRRDTVRLDFGQPKIRRPRARNIS